MQQRLKEARCQRVELLVNVQVELAVNRPPTRCVQRQMLFVECVSDTTLLGENAIGHMGLLMRPDPLPCPRSAARGWPA